MATGTSRLASVATRSHTARIPAPLHAAMLSDRFFANSPGSVREQFSAASSITALMIEHQIDCTYYNYFLQCVVYDGVNTHGMLDGARAQVRESGQSRLASHIGRCGAQAGRCRRAAAATNWPAAPPCRAALRPRRRSMCSIVSPRSG
jgi:hypothetical protein